ncbi:MAG: rubrerythrin family protein [Deltaproteobacteria bacterium]|nr:rubrerythrin family protein [Deltaproteobacteria bacterium]
MSRSGDNLLAAFEGESQASARYLAFAETADAEGYPGTAKLFRAAARAELVHARNHLKAARRIGGTLDNVRAAIEGETHEFKEMYPDMVKDAVEEGDTEARHSFEFAMSIEMVHAKLFKKALENPAANPDAVYYVCPLCGHTVLNEPPKKCPYCGVDSAKFMEIP